MDEVQHQAAFDHDGFSAQSTTSRPTVIRKKFAKPPVKVACLACRASRTRCDGQDPCANCKTKKRHCSYLPSKRGGPRKKKSKLRLSAEDANQYENPEGQALEQIALGFENCMVIIRSLMAEVDRDIAAGLFDQIDVLSAPTAGLRSLDFSPIFQSLFAGLLGPNDAGDPHARIQESLPSSSSSRVPSSMGRTYGSEPAILNAYYDYIHNYFPILPPRAAPAFVDSPLDGIGAYTESPSEKPTIAYQPKSPLSLAICAALALIPHPNDSEPSSPSSVIRRRTFAHKFAQMANAGIESDCELHASPGNPFETSSSNRPFINREPLHPQTPVGLESLLALLVLSVYEYTQRGNLLKMRYRAGQALAIALDMSLHFLGEKHDELAEARRRAWWMTYYCVLQGSIVSTTPLSIDANNPQFVTPYPRFSGDPDTWSIFVQAQKLLVAATQFVIDLKKSISTMSNMPYIFESMQRLDNWASAILAQSNSANITVHSADSRMQEDITEQSMRVISRIKVSSAQIKIHRFRAFSNIPIFLKKHCDLNAANSPSQPPAEKIPQSPESGEEISNIGCSCGSLDSFHQSSASESAPSSPFSPPAELPSLPQYSFINEFPYSSQHSAKVCLRAALSISHTFQSLPLPRPLDDATNTPPHRALQSLPRNQYPRAMPSFACCLVQGSYALLMLFYQASLESHVSAGLGQDGGSLSRYTAELGLGLERIIDTVTNYAVAYEALNGMREDISGAYQTAFLQR